MELVSIIVPVYNVEPYLDRCVASLISQTYHDVEIILVDDCSKDGSRAVIERWCARDSRVVGIYQAENHGVSVSRNVGIDAAHGEWLCFCDGDDWIENDFVEKLMACAKEKNADYVMCNYKIVSGSGTEIVSGSLSGLPENPDRRTVIACGPISSCTHMIKRELFTLSGARYPEGCRQFEELPVIPVIAKYSSGIAVLNEPLYNYFQRGNGSSASNNLTDSSEVFLRCWNEMARGLGEGYEEELNFHAIYALAYGEVMKLCKKKAKRSEIVAAIADYEAKCGDFMANKYVPSLGRAKTTFLKMAKMRFVPGLRLLSFIHSIIVH